MQDQQHLHFNMDMKGDVNIQKGEDPTQDTLQDLGMKYDMNTQAGENPLQAILQEVYEEVGMKPDGNQSRQMADAAKELSAASQAAGQSQLVSESILLQGRPV
eukprot:14495111-Alexandrium_andersonii.AAC.1